jgi:phage virion morphogenesis protein
MDAGNCENGARIVDITASVDNRGVIDLLDRLRANVGDLTPTMQAIGLYYERRVLENFKAESSPDGTPWAPLSAVTLHLGLAKNKGWKKSGYLSARGTRYLQGKRILWERGDLEGSVHSQASKDSVTIGTGGHIPYAAIHQFGGQAGRGRKVTIPARPYLALNRGTELELAESDQSMVVELIRERLLSF